MSRDGVEGGSLHDQLGDWIDPLMATGAVGILASNLIRRFNGGVLPFESLTGGLVVLMVMWLLWITTQPARRAADRAATEVADRV